MYNKIMNALSCHILHINNGDICLAELDIAKKTFYDTHHNCVVIQFKKSVECEYIRNICIQLIYELISTLQRMIL